MDDIDKKAFSDEMENMGVIHPERKISKKLMGLYFNSLKKYTIEQVCYGFKAQQANPETGHFFPKPSNIIAEIEKAINTFGGHLEPNEAWSLACHLKYEFESGAVTKEIIGAMEASSLCPDDVSARMAFIERYKRLCQQSTLSGDKVQWFMSYGSDKQRAADAVQNAVNSGLLSRDKYQHMLPDLSDPETGMTKLIEGTVAASKDNPIAKKTLTDLMDLFKPKLLPDSSEPENEFRDQDKQYLSRLKDKPDLNEVEKQLVTHYAKNN